MMTIAKQPERERPIFLVGPERAGTTLLRLMLDSHPRIAWCNEFEYAVDRMAEGGRRPDLEKYHEWLGRHRVFRATGFSVDPRLSYDDLVDDFLRQRRRAAGKAVVGATVHRHYRRLTELWPEARFIHLTRDPRDVARSQIGMGWAGNVWCASEGWIDAELERDRLRDRVSPRRQHDLTYEQLVRCPQAELERICDFIGVPYDDAMLTYPDRTTYRAPDAALVEQWKGKLADREIELVEQRCGDLLSSRGYRPVGLAPQAPGRFERLALTTQNRLARAGFRARRYGWSLWLGESSARRLGLRPLARKLRFRLDAVDVAHLK